ncbi:hypothetical protein SteCoe_19828 [Stentor coeruleus]|uniref:KHA domain-containing protein n=1 Tax=Stentor coeruleus TaxID=5963 RepID=A0A1R2BTC8_9CILI|nr:hypothetical protein SteCoe_19828 [Stentor coeruleus]
MDKIRVVIYKNTQHPTDGKQILIEPSLNKDQLLTLCSGILGIKAKKVFNEKGNELSSIKNIHEGTSLYISSGESFQLKVSSENRVNKSFVLCMLGTAAVGKSAVTHRFVQNKFLKDYDPTIEDYYKKVVNVDSETVPLSILDTAGMEDYYPLIDDWIDKKDGFVLLFSVNLIDSMTKLESFYHKILHRYPNIGNPKNSPVIVIAGNKVDLPNRGISYEEGKKFAESLKCRYFEVSALTGAGIEEMYTTIVRELLSRRATKPQSASVPWYEKCELL